MKWSEFRILVVEEMLTRHGDDKLEFSKKKQWVKTVKDCCRGGPRRDRVERSPANFRRAYNPRHKTDRSYRRRRRETRLIPRHRSEVSRGGMKLEEDDGPREIRTAEIRAVKYVASGK